MLRRQDTLPRAIRADVEQHVRRLARRQGGTLANPLATGLPTGGNLPGGAGGGIAGTTDPWNYDNPLTTEGDLLTHDGTRPIRLGIGSGSQLLGVSAGRPAWVDVDILSDPTTTEGDLIYRGAAGLTRLGISATPGQVLTVGVLGHPVWADPTGGGGGMENPMTAEGDMIWQGPEGPDRLAGGNDQDVLMYDGTGGSGAIGPFWAAPPWIHEGTLTTRGDIIYRNASQAVRLGIGTVNQVLTVTDIGSGVLEPRWAAAQGFANPMTAVGSLIRGGTGGAAVELAAGTDGYYLKMVSGVPTWADAPFDGSLYALLAGRAGGQTLYGGLNSGDDLYLRSTSNATKGDVRINDQGGDVFIGADTSVLYYGSDLNLYRGGTNMWSTDDAFTAGGIIQTNGGDFRAYNSAASIEGGYIRGYKSRGGGLITAGDRAAGLWGSVYAYSGSVNTQVQIGVVLIRNVTLDGSNRPDGCIEFYTKTNASGLALNMTLNPDGTLNVVGGYKANGTAGATGSFTDGYGRTIGVQGGLIVSIP